MDVQLKNIAPHPLIGAFSSNSQIWEKELIFKEREFIHLQAPSGSGKSTLLGILYGTRKDYNGDVLVDGKEVKEWSELRSQNISIVFQELELLGDLTVLENIQLKNQITGHLSDAQIHQMGMDLDIEALMNNRVATLSRGERQRVAIIRAMCMPFNWLLLDEPFSALDEKNTGAAIQLIKKEVEKNKAGVILANLFSDSYFDYDQKLKLA